MKPKSHNAKASDWEVPVTLHGVDPADYSKAIDSANGSAAGNAGKAQPDSGPPDYTLPGRAHKKGA